MNIVALLTGRGNNTLANKNILPVLNRPLLAYPCEAAKNVDSINHHYVSSDDDDILEAASQEGYKKIKRPREISTPSSQHIDSIFHAIEFLKKEENISPDILVVGSDWRGKVVVGGVFATEVKFFERLDGYSTTKILENSVNW